MTRSQSIHPTANRGFTLLELLISIALIAVVLTLVMTSLSSLRGKGQATVCTSNLKQIAAAAITYSSDHNGSLPPYNRKGKYWYLFLMHSELVGRTEGRGPLPNENPQHRKEVKTVYQCPANDGRIAQYSTPNYAYNRALGDSLITSVEQPGRIIMFADAGFRQEGPEHYYSNANPATYPEKVCCYITDYVGASFPWERSLNFDLHNQRANIAFVDGHVEALSREEVRERGENLTLLWSRGNNPINNDKSPNFWSPASQRAN